MNLAPDHFSHREEFLSKTWRKDGVHVPLESSTFWAIQSEMGTAVCRQLGGGTKRVKKARLGMRLVMNEWPQKLRKRMFLITKAFDCCTILSGISSKFLSACRKRLRHVTTIRLFREKVWFSWESSSHYCAANDTNYCLICFKASLTFSRV